MLLKTYSRRLFRAECNPLFESLHCIAALDQDVSAALPYLNSVLGGFRVPHRSAGRGFFAPGGG